MKLSLLVLTPGKMEGKALDIKLSQFVIGRDPQCHLRPASPLISKRHCAILVKDGKAFVRDFDSTNGTLVNDAPINGECELHHDDRLKVGPLLFAVRIEPDAAPTKTPAPATRPATAGKTPPPATRAAKPTSGTAPTKTPAPATAPAKTPPPATAPAPAAASSSPPAETSAEVPAGSASGANDDDVMAMLLEMGDDGTEGEVPRGPDGVPDGSTVMDIKLPETPTTTTPSSPGTDDKGKKDEKKPAIIGDTRSAAASILEKMMKRPRS